MRKILLMFDNIHIRRKFLLVYIFFVCMPIMAGAIIWFAFTSNELWQKEILYLDQNLSTAANDLSVLTENAINIANQVNEDKMLRADLSKKFSSPVEHYQLYWELLRERFKMYMVGNSDIAQMTLYIDNPDFMNYDYFRVLDEDVKNSQWYKAAKETNATIFAYPASTSSSIVFYDNRITIIRKIQKADFFDNAENYLLIELKLDRVINSINSSRGNMDVYLTASDKEIVWSTTDNNDMTFPQKYNVMSKEVGLFPYFKGWELIGIYNKNEIYIKQFQVFIYIFLITLSISLFSVFLIWVLLNSMKYRITALSQHMKNIKGQNFEPLNLESNGNDEIGWLITAFNDMIAEIKGLIDDVYVLEMQKKDMEMEYLRTQYKYLQAQVDPHFLFNTLNAILVFCMKNEYTELSAIISNLAKLLKRLLITKDTMIHVEEEFDFIDKYLSIEKFRFGDRFSYEIHIDDEIRENFIPPLSIQPIVENACKHGLQSIRDNRKLILRGYKEDSVMVISIEDNGAGMSDEKIEEIWVDLCEKGDYEPKYTDLGSGIGLQNVYRRLKMTYGTDFQFKIQSEPFVKTLISIRIEEKICTKP